MTTTATKATNFSAGPSMADLVAVNCERDGFRFHVWMDPRTLDPGAILYKNCQAGLKRGQPGHFDCKKLDASAAVHALMVAEMRERAPALIAEFREREAEEQRAKEAEWKAAAAVNRAKEAGPALLAALELALPMLCDAFEKCNGIGPGAAPFSAARAAIALAQGQA